MLSSPLPLYRYSEKSANSLAAHPAHALHARRRRSRSSAARRRSSAFQHHAPLPGARPPSSYDQRFAVLSPRQFVPSMTSTSRRTYPPRCTARSILSSRTRRFSTRCVGLHAPCQKGRVNLKIDVIQVDKHEAAHDCAQDPAPDEGQAYPAHIDVRRGDPREAVRCPSSRPPAPHGHSTRNMASSRIRSRAGARGRALKISVGKRARAKKRSHDF